MGKKIIILGGGFGGLCISNILRQNLDITHEIIVIDKKDYFMMGLTNLWILDGQRSLEDSKIPLSNLESKGIKYIQDIVTVIDVKSKIIKTLRHLDPFKCDFLVIALGAELATDVIPGFDEYSGFNLYDAEHIPCLRKKILSLEKGRIAIAIMGIPYKCPPAPYEAAFIIDKLLRNANRREKIEIDIYFPSKVPLPVAGQQPNLDLISLLKKQNINLFPNFSLKKVNSHYLQFDNKQKKEYSILIGIPFHFLPPVLSTSGLLEKEHNWIAVDKFTLKTKFNNVFAIGDVTEIKINDVVSVPKAGIFAEGQARSVASQIINKINIITKEEEEEKENNIIKFDGKGFCFMDTGNGKAGFIDTNFYNSNGPITILKEPSIQYYKQKINFESQRIKEWL
ncbi:MAG TPA: FAD/NAD(P)-binding oxidoreductase [Nitrososphaeraceae archaeon]|nr:FAD/NAD(P)-binding oxidoreductase [Nitrososphaeraceae archaeon]